MTAKEYNKGVATIVKTIVANNAGGVARALKDAGYPTKNYIPSSELEAVLLQLSMTDHNKFVEVIKNVPWNNGDVATNTPQVREALMKLVNAQPGSELARSGNWWDIILGLFTQQQPPPPQQAPPSNIWGNLALAVVATVTAVLIYKLVVKFLT